MSKKLNATTDLWLEIYRAMRRQRVIDNKMVALQRSGRIGFYGTSTGQEASAVGSVAALEPQDWVVPALRESAAALYRGLPLEQYLAQLFGNSLDWTQGRQMPCHFTYREGNFLSMSSVIGTQLPHAVGIAMSIKIKKEPAVVMAYMGDGATSSADFHAALNFAGVYRAPVVFICQNSHWAISLPSSQQTASKDFASKAAAYGFAGVRVDGNDAVAVYKASRDAVKKARTGGGPTLIETETYRIDGHTTSDDSIRYRDVEEINRWKERDPIERMRKYLEKEKLWDKKQEEQSVSELTHELDVAIKKVEAAPPPSLHSLIEDVFAEVPAHLEKQLREQTE